MASNDKPRLIPTGTCWCGCEREVGLGKFFAAGHDKAAEAALIALKYEGSVPHFLHAHGYGPHHSVSAAAVKEGVWVECDECSTKPGYRGTQESVQNHKRKYHRRSDENEDIMGVTGSLGQAVRALGGLWDTQRAVTALRDAGHGQGDEQQQEKRAREALRQLADGGLLVKVQDRPVQYRATEK
jgi:hypothetical protein